MGALDEDVGTFLKLLFLNIWKSVWKSLSQQAQHRLEILSIVVAVLAIIGVIIRDLQSSQSGLREARRAFKGVVDEGSRGMRTICRRLAAPENPEMIPAVALLLLAAFGTWPYNFYILTRIIVCPTLIWLALLVHPRRKLLWEIPIAVFALIFNPIAPFHLAKATWGMLNILAAIAIVPAIYLRLKAGPKAQTPRTAVMQVESKSVAVLPTTSGRKYRYCGKCSVRVGASDSFCKRCGNTLQ